MTKNFKPEVEEAIKSFDFENHTYQIELNTNHGRIVLDLLPDVAPGHVANMLALTKIGYYSGLIFHRIIGGFMIQGGCPAGSGTGGPGLNIDAEFNSTPHIAGVLSMARSSDPNSAGSQFFICLGTHAYLDNQYTAFGRTADEDSMSVVSKIGSVSTDGGDRPLEPVVIESANVIES